MLTDLRIQNLALMDDVTLECAPGFIAVTGETGAGKSVLLGGLALLAGQRAEKSLIRHGAETCRVEAALNFGDTSRIDTVLEGLDLPPCEEGQLLLTRTLSRTKAGRIHVNGQLTTVANLQALGRAWIDFHGPGEPQTLFAERRQLELLDAFARLGPRLAEYQKTFRAWQAKRREITELRGSTQLSADEADFLRGQIDKIDAAQLSAESIAALERDHARMAGAQDIIATAGAVAEALAGDDGVDGLLGPHLAAARDLGQHDTELAALADRLESLLIEAADLASAYEDVARESEFDPEQAAELETRMEAWMSLQRRYGTDLEAILAHRAEMAARLDRQGDLAGTLERLENEAQALEAKATAQAETLRAARVKAAKELAGAAGKVVNALGFKRAQFAIEVTRETQLRDYGHSGASFRFAPNAGQPLMPLNKIASSGEIARVMLALKAVLARVDATPVLVFDEVDANVGGEIARVVGRELAALGDGGHQVFCITHLPPVAATAASHYVVEKRQEADSTAITLTALHEDLTSRQDELARMLGDRDSPAAQEHARALLK